MGLLATLYFLLKVFARAVWCIVGFLVFVLTYFGYVLPLLCLRNIWPRFHWYLEGKLYRWLMSHMGYWMYSFGYDVIEYGDDLAPCEGERVLLVCNHQSTSDVPTIMAILESRKTACRKSMWIMSSLYKWTPFGMIAQVHGDQFVAEGRGQAELDNLRKSMRKVFWERDRHWVFLFPEGGFLYKRLESSQRYARKNGFPVLEHVTLPRMGAVRAALDACGPRADDETAAGGDGAAGRRPGAVKLLKDTVGAIRDKRYIKETRPPFRYVVDMTIAYPRGDPLAFYTVCFGMGEGCDIRVNYRLFDAKHVPYDNDDSLRDWLFARWQDKEQLLDHYYKTGVFAPGETGRTLSYSWLKILVQYIFWYGSAYCQYRIYKSALFYAWNLCV